MSKVQDIESKDKPAPHDAEYVYSSEKVKHWYQVAPSLKEKEKSRGEWIAVVLIMILILFAALMTGFELKTSVISPPAQVFGNCPLPAHIIGDNCLSVQTNTLSGTTTTFTVTAGSTFIPNYGTYPSK